MTAAGKAPLLSTIKTNAAAFSAPAGTRLRSFTPVAKKREHFSRSKNALPQGHGANTPRGSAQSRDLQYQITP
jgi:hypothetical protein